jgi:hypothetical protein
MVFLADSLTGFDFRAVERNEPKPAGVEPSPDHSARLTPTQGARHVGVYSGKTKLRAIFVV